MEPTQEQTPSISGGTLENPTNSMLRIYTLYEAYGYDEPRHGNYNAITEAYFDIACEFRKYPQLFALIIKYIDAAAMRAVHARKTEGCAIPEFGIYLDKVIKDLLLCINSEITQLFPEYERGTYVRSHQVIGLENIFSKNVNLRISFEDTPAYRIAMTGTPMPIKNMVSKRTMGDIFLCNLLSISSNETFSLMGTFLIHRFDDILNCRISFKQ